MRMAKSRHPYAFDCFSRRRSSGIGRSSRRPRKGMDRPLGRPVDIVAIFLGHPKLWTRIAF
jgi:hypothetical protein